MAGATEYSFQSWMPCGRAVVDRNNSRTRQAAELKLNSLRSELDKQWTAPTGLPPCCARVPPREDQHSANRNSTLLRKPDQIARNLCWSSRDRHRKCSVVQGTQSVTATSLRRWSSRPPQSAWCDRQFADRCAPVLETVAKRREPV